MTDTIRNEIDKFLDGFKDISGIYDANDGGFVSTHKEENNVTKIDKTALSYWFPKLVEAV
jgi:hypothetical protein